ncbi:hypothetical protein CERSUDRAFT_66784 [Gelatoporia subvermispora B]|uniref:Enoyl reductase (ER) domain-containing protein n=1 Tax=Ceriporiopsis subvermispora (strain B) TaxID=914234 RepID=M2QRZ8_CERS8|nr:hypothetical protein CERSUDRAFT_66784 [Gelatoporia subvermispora B]
MIPIELYPVKLKDNVIPGSDMAGEVIAIGKFKSVKGFKVGDRVITSFFMDYFHGDHNDNTFMSALGGPVDGVLTEYRLFSAHCLVHFPEHLTYEEASTLPCAVLTAYSALMGPVHVKGGDTILVQGTGGVSIFALQFAVATGATVTTTSSADHKLGTNGRGVDHIVEVGGNGTLLKSAKCIRYGGWIHNICVLGGCFFYQVGIVNRFITAIELKPVVDKVFNIEEVLDAHKYLDRQKHIGKAPLPPP